MQITIEDVYPTILYMEIVNWWCACFSKARDNLIFLQRWFAKFPEYRSRDFFIAGVSYGGKFFILNKDYQLR